jgi:hypothetical protein
MRVLFRVSVVRKTDRALVRAHMFLRHRGTSTNSKSIKIYLSINLEKSPELLACSFQGAHTAVAKIATGVPQTVRVKLEAFFYT